MPFKVIDGSGPSKEERDQQQKEIEQQQRREWAQSVSKMNRKSTVSVSVRVHLSNLVPIGNQIRTYS